MRDREYPPIPVDEYTELVQEYEQLSEQSEQTEAEVLRLRDARAAAIETDRIAQATALHEGTKDPGRSNTARVHKSLTAAEGLGSVLAEAAMQARTRLDEYLRTHCEELVAAAQIEADRHRERYGLTIDALVTAREDHWRSQRLVAWLSSDTSRRFKANAHPPGLKTKDLVRPNGEGVEIEHVLEALRNEVVPPAPERELDHWKLEKSSVMRNGKLVEESAVMVPVFKDEPDIKAQPHAGGLNIGGVPVVMPDEDDPDEAA
jgi:cell division septum initiation protein DivIVA